MDKRVYSLALFVFCVLFFTPLNYLLAASYDFYVDESVDDSGDGSEKNPFKNISEAINKIGTNNKDSKKIYIKNGKYVESFTLPDKVTLRGESTKAIIAGTITAKNNTSLENISVSSSSNGVIILGGADVEIANCRIINNGRIGIWSSGDGGKLSIRNSKISNNKTKGFYIEYNKSIEIFESEISDNREEGIDLRAKINGIIKNNTISGNGEGGIEVIVGKADLVISGNKIKNNKASGVATQFYDETKKIGGIKINSNTIQNNGKFGIDCNLPSGGKPPNGYWKESIVLDGGVLLGNKLGEIADACGIVDNSKVENIEEERIEVAKKEEAERDVKENNPIINIVDQDVEILIENNKKNIDIIDNNIANIIKNIDERGWFAKLFFGVDTRFVFFAKKQIINKDNLIINLEELSGKITDEKRKGEIKSLIDFEINKTKDQKLEIEKKEKSFSFLGWLLG